MEKARLNTKLLGTLTSVLFMQAVDLREAAGIARSTWYNIMARPETITVQYLLSIANGLHIPVRRFFSTGRADFVGRREDYVMEPYTDCYYEGEALREAINDRQDATWKRAGEIAGMNYQSIQKSLSSETRTPVVRFLAVCEAFGIDPFTILIDPNPEAQPETRRRTRQPESDLPSGISALREDIGRLAEKVADVTRKYDSLLESHRSLQKQFDEHVSDGSRGRAAEDPVP